MLLGWALAAWARRAGALIEVTTELVCERFTRSRSFGKFRRH